MKLIVGLGNPGEKYARNRHNVGFMFVDWLVAYIVGGQNKNLNIKNQNFNRKLEAEIIEINLESGSILLAKPQTFMNESGRAVKKIVSRFRLNVSSDLYIVHDDLDILLGQHKVQFGKGPKLHNGIKSIERHLGTKDFWRVRVGVDNRPADNRILGEAYVLQNFTPEELSNLTPPAWFPLDTPGFF